MIRCLIIDSDPMASLAIRNYVEEVGFLDLVGECEDAIQAIDTTKKKNVDLLFLEVELPKMSGFEILEALPEKPMVIVTTAKPDYAIKAFDVEALDYLLKPVQLPRLLKATNRAFEHYSNQKKPTPRSIFIKVDNLLTRIDLDDIFYIEAMGDHIHIITRGKKYVAHLILKDLAEKLPADRFVKIHRSYIVALGKIDSYVDNMAVVNRKVLPVGETYRVHLLNKLINSP